MGIPRAFRSKILLFMEPNFKVTIIIQHHMPAYPIALDEVWL